MYGQFTPFRDSDTFTTFRNLVDNVVKEIESLQNEEILNASNTELESYYIDQVSIEPLRLDLENRYIEDQKNIKTDVIPSFSRNNNPISVPGTQLNIAIPFSGDSKLWQIRPSGYTLSGYPLIKLASQKVLLTVTFADNSVDEKVVKQQIESDISSLDNAVQNLLRDVEAHNKNAPNQIKLALEEKRKQAKKAIDAIANLGIPVKRRDKPLTYVYPATRRATPTSKHPKVMTEKYQPEPVLDMDEYEYILKISKSMGMVMERSPSSFCTLDEEAIRTHFLLQLNGHYEGSATGETFNAQGKTDILIRVENKNIFIAECKFWRGEQGFSEAIDQLLGYLSWRDSKCALLIFNKNKDSSSVKNKMHEVMENLSEHRKTKFHNQDEDSQYIFVKADDPGKEIIITTQLFDIPTN